jgi:sugar phosphate isomerase/epimerase
MNRRNFIVKSGLFAGACLSSPMLAAGKKNPMNRIGLTSYVFRDRFVSKNNPNPRNKLTLRDIPAFFSERFGIRNIEFFSLHFESLDPEYLNDLKSSLKRNKCKLINIQVDTPGFDISDPDSSKREPGIARIKEWIDAGAYLGSEMIRASRMTKSLEVSIESVKQLTEYAASKKIKFVVENHGDMYMNADYHVRIAKELKNYRNFGLIADFGNYPAGTDYLASLKMIAPYSLLASAKTKEFDENYNHLSYDFDQCVKVMEANGFKGVYSLEQAIPPGNYAFGPENYDYERITDWMIERVKANI